MIKFIFLLIFGFCCSSVNLSAQEHSDKKNTAAAYVAPGFLGTWMLNSAFGVGCVYSRHISERRAFSFGIENIYNRTTGNFDLTGLSLQTRRHFGKFFYINYGPKIMILNAETNKGWGFGLNAGIGFEYQLDNGITFSLNPFYGIISSGPLVHTGISAGIGYRF